MASLKGWNRKSALTPPLPFEWSKFKQLVISGKLGEELKAAYKYVRELPKMEPAGRRCATRTRELAEIRQQIADNAEDVMFSATLTELCLQERALSTIDCGRIAYIIETADVGYYHNSLSTVFNRQLGESTPHKSLSTVFNRQHSLGFCIAAYSKLHYTGGQ